MESPVMATSFVNTHWVDIVLLLTRNPYFYIAMTRICKINSIKVS